MLPVVLAVRFLLELILLAVFGWWGYRLVGGPAGLAVGALFVVVVAVVWGALLSPKARIRLAPAMRTGVELAVFLVAALALASLGHTIWGVALVAADVAVLLALSRLGASTGGDPKSGHTPH